MSPILFVQNTLRGHVQFARRPTSAAFQQTCCFNLVIHLLAAALSCQSNKSLGKLRAAIMLVEVLDNEPMLHWDLHAAQRNLRC